MDRMESKEGFAQLPWLKRFSSINLDSFYKILLILVGLSRTAQISCTDLFTFDYAGSGECMLTFIDFRNADKMSWDSKEVLNRLDRRCTYPTVKDVAF